MSLPWPRACVGPALLLCGLTAGLFPLTAAPATWIKGRSGPFEAISDDGRKTATESLSQFEQFRFALGSVMGNPDLRLDPPLRILVFRNQQELSAQGFEGIRMGRDRLMACAVATGQLPAELNRELAHRLLEKNFGAMPPAIERGLESFFSTVQSRATHVTWGGPPAVSERTPEWAMLHRIITQPDYAGKARIFLHNLAGGMDRPSAIRNAFGEDAAKFEADVVRYAQAGAFATTAAPYRPIDPNRDFATAALTSDEGQLMRADLLTPASAAIYQALLKAGKHVAECNEGLALLAIQANDLTRAREYMGDAVKAGTRNAVALTAYARIEPDNRKALEILDTAVKIDGKYAPARWLYGERTSDPRMRVFQWKFATSLEPRNSEWWAKYAQASLDRKEYTEASRAWVAAAQSAPDAKRRDEYLNQRGLIDQHRLDAEEAERRKELDAKAAEIEQLKAEARKEIHDLEARSSKRPLAAGEAVMDWTDDPRAQSVRGVLQRVDCLHPALRLHVLADDGKSLTLAVRDLSRILVQGGQASLSCGAQKQLPVTISYHASTTPRGGIAGEVTGIEFR